MTKPKRTIYKITNPVFWLALCISLVATLGFIFAILAQKPVPKSEGWKLIGLYTFLGLLALLRWLVGNNDNNQPD